MGNSVEEEQKKEQAQNPIIERPALVHKATSYQTRGGLSSNLGRPQAPLIG
jgi:hypothetical protein